jgi:molybdenum cofactor cytidylyltransferase
MGTPKALLPFHGRTFLDGLIARLEVHCDPVMVVLGHEAGRIRAAITGTPLVAVNADYPLGMLSSLQCGLRALPAGTPYVVFTLVDHPDPADSTIAAVVKAPPAAVVIPRFQSVKGHPVRLSRGVIGELLALPPDAKPSDVLHRHLDATHFIDTTDRGVVDDVDDRAAYHELLARVGQAQI